METFTVIDRIEHELRLAHLDQKVITRRITRLQHILNDALKERDGVR